MTYRIDRVFGDDGIVILSISGRITKHDLDILHNAIEAEASAVAIDLENVDLVDGEIVRFLAQKELNGNVLRNCSGYIREWVTRVRTEMMEKAVDI